MEGTAGNRRDAYRVPFDARASIDVAGRRYTCQISDLSAGGLMLACDSGVPVGAAASLAVQLRGELAAASGVPMLSFEVELLSVVPFAEAPKRTIPAGWRWLRCRNTSPEGSPEYERATRVVFAAERARRAGLTGVDESTGMVSSRERRDGKRPAGPGDRFGKGNVNPLFDE